MAVEGVWAAMLRGEGCRNFFDEQAAKVCPSVEKQAYWDFGGNAELQKETKSSSKPSIASLDADQDSR